jgi:chemotaxis protein CheD
MPANSLIGFGLRVVVGVAELAVSNSPTATLTTYSLGSCLGITIYDPIVRVGGLLHVMLPESSIAPAKATTRPEMFVDTGLPKLLAEAGQFHAQKSRLILCVAGGAQVMDSSGFFNIGQRNYQALRSALSQHGLHVHAEDIGGLSARTMSLQLATGEVRLKCSGQSNEIPLCKTLTPISAA